MEGALRTEGSLGADRLRLSHPLFLRGTIVLQGCLHINHPGREELIILFAVISLVSSGGKEQRAVKKRRDWERKIGRAHV